MDLRVGGKYRIKKRIGSGSFGEIYIGENILTNEEIAIKLESKNVRPPQLFSEVKIYKLLSGSIGIPQIYWSGIEGDYSVMVMDLLGKSLEELFTYCHRKFSLKTVLMIADQLISRMEYIHSKGFLHRDIKPDNFTIGLGKNSNNIYLLDFGLSKRYLDQRTHEHIPLRDGKPLTGTARYVSIATHLGLEQSRRDDLESIAYILIYFLKGQLPWQGLQGETRKEKYEAIFLKKRDTPIDLLCENLPNAFYIFLSEIKRLDFQETPNYSFYRYIFRELFIAEDYFYDFKFDWILKENQQFTNSLPIFKDHLQFNKQLYSNPLISTYRKENSIQENNLPSIYSNIKVNRYITKQTQPINIPTKKIFSNILNKKQIITPIPRN